MDFDVKRIEEHLMQVAKTSGSAAATEALLVTVGSLSEALEPVIGPRGAAALYARSLHIARRTHEWLPAEIGTPSNDLTALRLAFAGQVDIEGARAGATMLSAFNTVLTSLIGAPLAARLLGRVSIPTPSSSTTPEESS